MSTYGEFINESLTSAPQDYLKGPFSVFIKDISYYKYGSADYLKTKLLTEEEIENNYKSINDKDALVIWQILSEDFIVRHILDLNLILITKYQVISEQFIRRYCMPLFISSDKKYFNKLLFNIICHQKLSEEFIREFLDIIIDSKLGHSLCKYQELGKDLILTILNKSTGKPYQDIIYRYLTKYQELTMDIVDQYPQLLNNHYIRRNLYTHQLFPEEFYTKYHLPLCNASNIPEEDWKFMISRIGKFEFHDEYFYAYKLVRADNYSIYNYSYNYEKDNEYYTFSDYSYESESFGFEASTFRGMLIYKLQFFENSPKFKIIKVKVYYKDITYIDDFNNKYEDVVIRSNKVYIVDDASLDYDFVQKMYKKLRGKKLGEDFNMVVVPDHISPIYKPNINRGYGCFYSEVDASDDMLKLHEIHPGMIDF